MYIHLYMYIYTYCPHSQSKDFRTQKHEANTAARTQYMAWVG